LKGEFISAFITQGNLIKKVTLSKTNANGLNTPFDANGIRFA
jgi:hypothetical protein